MISENKPPQGLIIVMGVAGCGKSTVAIDVAHHHNLEFVEADDYHSDEARAKMAKGIPLTDADREPWIQAICALVKTIADQGSSAILACSALRKAHRDRFRAIGIPTVFLFLDGSEGLIQSRLENREGHFFPAAMLKSQFEALERPGPDETVWTIDINQSKEQVQSDANSQAQKFLEALRT